MTRKAMYIWLFIITVIITGLLLMHADSAFASIVFSLVETGTTSDYAMSVLRGGSFSVDVIASGVTAEGLTGANLDSFTYRILFPNEEFSLTSNTFASPFDNNPVPAGFNGSIPWTGLPLQITNGLDAGSPGATPFDADLYRTTATRLGTPATASYFVIEMLDLLAPMNTGDYRISLNILEAADDMGGFHTASVASDFTLTVVPIPSTLGLFFLGLSMLVLLKRRNHFPDEPF